MKKIVPILFLVFIVFMVIYRIATQAQTEHIKSIGEIQKEKGVPVEVEEAIMQKLEKGLNFTGTVEGIKQSEAKAKISEKIVELKVDVGDRVESGQVIAVLDKSSPQVAYTQAKLALQDAEREYKRMKSLYEQGAISKQIMDKTKLGYDVAEANYEQVQELLQIKAPIAGIITHIFFEEGETPPPGNAVATIANTDKIRVKLQAAQIYRNQLQRGQKALIYLSSAPEKKLLGRIERVALSADVDSRSFRVDVVADNPEGYLQPGVSVEVEIVVTSRDNTIVLHRNAVFMESGKPFVFVVNGTAKKVEVITGIQSGSKIEIISGINAGDQVVVHGQNLLNDGDLVNVINK